VGGVDGVGVKVLCSIKSMYEESMVCVRIGRCLGRNIRVDVRLIQSFSAFLLMVW
jgi:hypothetical protein